FPCPIHLCSPSFHSVPPLFSLSSPIPLCYLYLFTLFPSFPLLFFLSHTSLFLLFLLSLLFSSIPCFLSSRSITTISYHISLPAVPPLTTWSAVPIWAQCCLLLYILLFCSQYWLLPLLYSVWLYIDWDTPSRGGRRSEWVRGWTVWKYFANYFPIRLVRTAPLDPRHNYIFGFHPHGVLVVGAFGNFCTEGTGFSCLFPGLTPHLLMLSAWFRVPFFREYIMSGCLVSSDKKSASHLLSTKSAGQALVIAVGGPPEALDAKPGQLTLQIMKRTGFIKLALTHGAHLVPVLSFGENNLYYQVDNPPGSLLRTTQEKLQKMMGLALPLFHGRGVFQYSFGLLPHRRPVYTVGK
ncbi:hypothetical protein GDO81_023615, partial [Engystomops pustulosus]